MRGKFVRIKFIDKHGELWFKVGLKKVVRVSDGNIGNWNNGEGLKEATDEEKLNFYNQFNK